MHQASIRAMIAQGSDSTLPMMQKWQETLHTDERSIEATCGGRFWLQ